MADGYCSCCGFVFDMQQPACTQCGRCPECGTNVKGATCCPSCSHPHDPSKLAELERKLDPALPANRLRIERMKMDRRTDEIFSRVHWGKFCCVLLPAHLIAVLAWLWLFDRVGWSRGAMAASWVTTGLLWWFLRWQLGHGRCTWLLQRTAATDSRGG